MAQLPRLGPEASGWDGAALDRAAALARRSVEEGAAPGLVVCVGGRNHTLHPLCFGRLGPSADAPALDPESVFPIASLTKPVTAAAVMMLADRGLLSLHDRVCHFVPAFSADGRDEVRLIHLLTHTSGLPNLPPDNAELRKAHRPLVDFLAAACHASLLFPPGTEVSYQGLGFVLLGEIVKVVAGVPLSDFLDRELFTPLGMASTALGCPPQLAERVATIRLPASYQDSDWHWNSAYWRGLGAPWTGLLTTVGDYARFCRLMLNGGTLDGQRILSPAAVRAMTTNHLRELPVPKPERRCRPWGLGWRLNWPGDPTCFCDLLGANAYGHAGASGSLSWIDPKREAFCLIFSNQVRGGESRLWPHLSNALAAAVL